MDRETEQILAERGVFDGDAVLRQRRRGRIRRLETALLDTLFTLDGVHDGDFEPRGSAVTSAIQSAKETLSEKEP